MLLDSELGRIFLIADFKVKNRNFLLLIGYNLDRSRGLLLSLKLGDVNDFVCASRPKNNVLIFTNAQKICILFRKHELGLLFWRVLVVRQILL